MANLAVFGLGYVGSVTAACFAAHGHHVVGVEKAPSKVALLRNGISPVTEPGLTELLRDHIATGTLTVAEDAYEAVARSSIGFITVGTPSTRNGDVDLSALETVLNDIGGALRKRADPYTVVLRSTVLPGTTADFVIPTLLRASGRALGKDLDVVFNPEFLREGTAIQDFYDPPFVVLGQTRPTPPPTMRALWSTLPINAPWVEVNTNEAEMLKYTCNAFHALKIAFANEVGAICQQLDIDAEVVMSLVVRDTKLNISRRYLKPGFAYGGSCLPKDVHALQLLARRLDIDVPLVNSISASNDRHLSRAITAVLETGLRRVSVIGLGFKAGTDDVRNSPAVFLCEQLLGKGLYLSIFDRHVVPEYLVGRNKDFLQAKLPHIATLLKPSIEDCVAASDLVVICNDDPDLQRALANANIHAVIDLTSGNTCVRDMRTAVATA